MTEGIIANAMRKMANAGLLKFLKGAIFRFIWFTERLNSKETEYDDSGHAEAIESLEQAGFLSASGVRMKPVKFVRDEGSCLELLLEPPETTEGDARREVLAIRFTFRNGGYAFWASDADLERPPCAYIPNSNLQTRMAVCLVFEGESQERNFVVCETSEAMNRVDVSVVHRDLLVGEVLGSHEWRRRVYNCGPCIFEEIDLFRSEMLKSLLGTGRLFGGAAGVDFGNTHAQQAQRPWIIVIFARNNGMGWAGTGADSEIVGCVRYELGIDAGRALEIFRNSRPLAEDLVEIAVRLAHDLGQFDDRYDPRVRDPACMATMRCNMMVCYKQKGHYQIGPKGGTTKNSNVHHRFWTPPITSCESARALRRFKYRVITEEGPLAKHGGSPNTLNFGIASWGTGCDQKLFQGDQVREPIPRPEPKEGKTKAKRVGPRDRRKLNIYAGSYASKTPKLEEPKLESKVEGDLVGERIKVVWEKGSHKDVMEKDELFPGLVVSHDAERGTHHVLYDDFSEEDEFLNELVYYICRPGEKDKKIVGPDYVPDSYAGFLGSNVDGADDGADDGAGFSGADGGTTRGKKRNDEAQSDTRAAPRGGGRRRRGGSRSSIPTDVPKRKRSRRVSSSL